VTARDEILAALPAVRVRNGADDFTVDDVIRELRVRGSRYLESTIRTHVTSRMCVDSPGNHAVTYDDLERIATGIYRQRADP
jgi:hypothetical protein